MAQWIFKISGSNADSLTRSYTPRTGLTFRILKDAADKWSLVTGEWLDPHDDSSLGQLAMRGGAVALESHIKGCVIRPWDATVFDNAPTQSRWTVLLPKSRVRCRKAAFLRPGDVVEWKDHGVELSISFTQGTDVKPKAEVKDELPKVEVSSSAIKQEPSLFGIDGAADYFHANDTETDDDDYELNIGSGVSAVQSQELSFTGLGDYATSQSRRPSTPEGEPFSTARTAATVIQETPTVKRQRLLTQENMDDVDESIGSVQPATAQSGGPAVVSDSMKTALDKELSDEEPSVSVAPVDEADIYEAKVDKPSIDNTPAQDLPTEEAPVDEEQRDEASDENAADEDPDDEGPDEEAATLQMPHQSVHGNQAVDMDIEDAVPEAVDATLTKSEQVPSSIKEEGLTKEESPIKKDEGSTKAEDPIKEEASPAKAPNTTPRASTNTDTQDERDLPELSAVMSQSSAKSGTKRKATELLEDFEEPVTAQRSTRGSSVKGKKHKVEQASPEIEEDAFMQDHAHGPAPVGLDGLKILVTGTLEGLTRREVTQLIEDNGGIYEKNLKKPDIDFVVLARKPGPQKLEEIQERGLRTIDQTELMRMIYGHEYKVPVSDKKLRESQEDEYAGPRPRILFSQTDVNERAVMKQFLKTQNAIQSNTLDKKVSNFLCVGPGELKTTPKLLISLIYRNEIVTESWVTDSQKAGHLLQTTDYLPDALEATNFDVDRSILFKGQNICFTPALKKFYGERFKEMEIVVKAAGADNVGSKPAKDIIKPGYEAIAIGLETGDSDVLALQGNNWTVYKKDFISSSILAGELQIDDPDLVIPRKDSAKAVKPVTKSKRISKG
ncbi:hypothetical protein MBLNU457_6776t1 [Dothideomycetes sp. NU457]